MILSKQERDKIRVSQRECRDLAGRMYPDFLIEKLLDTCDALEKDLSFQKERQHIPLGDNLSRQEFAPRYPPTKSSGGTLRTTE